MIVAIAVVVEGSALRRIIADVPSVIAGAIAWMHNRAECPTVLATISAPMGEKPVFVLSKIYNLLTNEVIWKKD